MGHGYRVGGSLGGRGIGDSLVLVVQRGIAKINGIFSGANWLGLIGRGWVMVLYG